MIPKFRGRFSCKTDIQGRLSLPPAYRPPFNGEKKASFEHSFIITNSQYKRSPCLDVYTLKNWEFWEERVNQLSKTHPQAQAYGRFYMSAGQVVVMDNQSRLLIPLNLRKYAQITSQVMLVGMGDRFEIWACSLWEKVCHQFLENFETVMESMARLEMSQPEIKR